LVHLPLLREDRVVGVFSIYRQEVRPFTDKQIALLQNFAAQAVIATENARLLTETREALEQQTATAEVLQVINSSPGDLAPVFDAMLEKAARLCEAHTGHLGRWENGALTRVASFRVPEEFDQVLPRNAPMPDALVRKSVPARMIATRSIVHVPDLRDDESFHSGAPVEIAAVRAGIRTALYVPMLKEREVVGGFVMHRLEVRPFTDKQIALVQNFAAQAVIAMENARLITETREALEQQTATAEVLQVINSSPGDLAPVFDVILEKAHALCAVAQGALELYDGETFRAVATRLPESFAERVRKGYRGAENPISRELLGGARFVHVPNVADAGNELSILAAELGGFRTSLFVPLRIKDKLLGQIVANRTEIRPFTEKEIALLENFAAQAVIAMENARLLTETREALEQQTATAEVLQVINSSPGNLSPVFDAMLDNATRLCEAVHGQLATYDGEFFRFVAVHGGARMVEEQQARGLLSPSFGVTWPRLLRGDSFVHVTDVMDTDLYRTGHQGARWFVDIGGGRSVLTVALRKEDALLGALTVYRREVRPFADKQIALLQNFAAQAVIAMENARLITETREALEQQTATADILEVINR
jgi:GAF domain-containing protein